MKIKDLFRIGNVQGPIAGSSIYLDRDNCQIRNKSKIESAVILKLVREIDKLEGKSYLRVRDEFESVASELLNRVFTNDKIIGLTLNQLADFETNINIEESQGQLTIT